VFGQFGWGEMLLLVIVGLFVFGPERLPTVARDAAKIIRQFRDTARGMRDELKAELGPEMADLDLDSLNPRKLVEKHLMSEDEIKDLFEDDDDSADGARRPAAKRDGSQKNGADANGSSRRRPPATTLHAKSKIPLAKDTGSDLPGEDASGESDSSVVLSKRDAGEAGHPAASAPAEPAGATSDEGGAVLEPAQSAPIRKVTPADRPEASTGASASTNTRYDDEDVM
jgi:sec-independent protein translocase protein TatB